MKTTRTGLVALVAIIQAVWLSGIAASAAIRYWNPTVHAGGGTSEWANPENWILAGTNDPGVPGPDDHAVIHSWGPMPVIASDVGTVNILTPAWHSGVTSEVTVAEGGYIYVAHFMRMSQSAEGIAPSVGTLNITGGHAVVNILQLGFNDAGDGLGAGYVNIDAGFLHCGDLGFGVADARIDIEEGAYLFLNGDRTADVAAWVAAGKITGGDGTMGLEWAYDTPNPGLTAVWAVPKPSAFRIAAIERSGPGHVRLLWEPMEPAYYFVESAPAAGGEWVPLAGPLTVEEYEDLEAGLARRMYRVVWETEPPPQTILDEDFEGGPGGWSAGSEPTDNWEWGVPQIYPEGGPPAAASGTNVWATGLAGPYELGTPAGSDVAVLSSPAIDLTGFTGATLTFQSWVETEANFDFVRLEIRDAGTDALLGTVLEQTGETPSWVLEEIDLGPYTGRSIRLLFILKSDSVAVDAGWAIDDVRITSP